MPFFLSEDVEAFVVALMQPLVMCSGTLRNSLEASLVVDSFATPQVNSLMILYVISMS